jgi:hypothetical protein
VPSNGAAGVSRAGFGKPGYCKLCASTALADVNEAIKNGWNARQVNTMLEAKYGWKVNRQTFYSHKEHASHPADRVVNSVEKAKADGNVLPRQSTPTQFLEAVRDLAMQRAIDHPEEVTIDHGIKAAQVLAQSNKRGGDITILLARVVTGGDPAVVIEGEFSDHHSQLIEFQDGTQWVDNDYPRDGEITAEIMEHTGRFAVATPDDEIVGGPYARLDKAEAARDGAKIKLDVDVDIEPEATEAEVDDLVAAK